MILHTLDNGHWSQHSAGVQIKLHNYLHITPKMTYMACAALCCAGLGWAGLPCAALCCVVTYGVTCDQYFISKLPKTCWMNFYELYIITSIFLQVKSLNGCLQALMGSMRPSYLKVINTVTTNWIMELEQPCSCISPMFCPWAAPSLTVRMPTGEVLGHIKHA